MEEWGKIRDIFLSQWYLGHSLFEISKAKLVILFKIKDIQFRIDPGPN